MKGIHNWIDFRGKTGIYLIHNKINNKDYVGSSLDIATRLSHHFGNLKRSCGNHDLWSDIQYFKKKNFECKILEETTKNNLKYAEQKWIEKLNPEYNKKNANDNLFRPGKTYSDYSLKHLRETHTTDEYRAYVSKIKTSEKGISVIMTTPEKENIRFDSYTQAYEYLVKHYELKGKKCSVVGHIRECCDGKRKKCCGCTFERVETIRKE